MSLSKQIPIGKRIPNIPHAVSVSLPTMADVIGYEKRDPRILAKMNSGYPRFVKHEWLREIEIYWGSLFDKPGNTVWLTSSEKIAHQLETHLDTPGTKFQKHLGVSGLRIPDDEQLNRKAKLFLQHVGGYLCSRQAEDYLVANGLKKQIESEALYSGDAEAKILESIRPLLNAEKCDDIILSNCGMNAIYAAFQAVNEIQAPKGRKSWIKLGWLYTDTMSILDKLSHRESNNQKLYNVFDTDKLQELLASRPNQFAGIVTETPTNPLIQSMDLERIRELATKHGVCLILDPTINSPANVDISPYADIIVNSLTKYASSEGDVIMGAVCTTQQCPERDAITQRIRAIVEPPYARNLQRLAEQIDRYLPLIESINTSTIQVVEYLKSHPKVTKVYWSKEARSKANYERIARTPESIGGIISFVLNTDLATFYDRLLLAKGPSFGMTQTLACPFMYLAHYDLISAEAGRAYLQQAGIDSELIRFSIGGEPVAEIIEALDYALA
ncbi:MAG: PLP-dependent transferase [Opitutales bacterium]